MKCEGYFSYKSKLSDVNHLPFVCLSCLLPCTFNAVDYDRGACFPSFRAKVLYGIDRIEECD